MKIILHIGQSKTGTTALQSFFSRNRVALAEQKILYPDVMLKCMPINMLNHNSFANALGGFNFFPRLSADEYWQQFMDQYEQGDYDTMLLSGESFFGGRPYLWELSDSDDYYKHYEKKLSNLYGYLKNHHVTVIAYLRPQIKWLESAIPQIIRYEGTMQQRIYFDDMQTMELLLPFMDYNSAIGLWDSVVKPKGIKIREYERESLDNNNIIVDFLNQLNINSKNLEISNSEDNVHDSWSNEFIEIKKELNLKPKSRIKEDTIIDLINRLNGEYGRKEKYQVEIAVYKKVLEEFVESNNKLSIRYNNNIPVFSDSKVTAEKYIYKLVSEESVTAAMKLFKQEYYSIRGCKSYLYNAFKRVLKKYSPFMFSCCSSILKKYFKK